MMKYLSDRYRISAIHSPYTWIIAYNTSDPLFTDPRVRHALSCCIDRGYLIKHLLTGYGEPVSSPFGANSPFGRPGKKEAPFDPEKGRQLLEAAGWQKNRGDGLYYKNGRPFEFTLLYPNENPVEQAVATHLKLSLYDMGIRVILKPASFKSLSAVYHYQNDYQAVLTVYKRVYHYSSSPLFSWLPTETGKVYMGNFQSPDLTARLQCLAACKDRECEISTCREIEDLLIDLQPITPLYSKKEITLISSRIALPYEFSPNYTAIHRLYEAKIIPEK
jgi:ABC-type transport system substrate-binding protein